MLSDEYCFKLFKAVWLSSEYLPEITILTILLQSTENRTDNPPVIILHSMVALEKFAQTSKFYTCIRKNPIYCRPRWLSWMRRPTGDQEVTGSILVEVGNSLLEIDHEIFSMVILFLLLIQEGQLSVSGERMCTILDNSLED